MRTELVHLSQDTVDSFRRISPAYDRVARNIDEIVDPVPIKDLKTDPKIPKDTQIGVGGAWLEVCVKKRVDYLRDRGYHNAYPDPHISFAQEDYPIEEFDWHE